MYSIIKFHLCLLLLIMTNSQTQKPTFTYLTGKTYSAEIRASCKSMSDSTCMLYTFCILHFKQDHVSVYYITKASCTNKSREAGYTSNTQEEQVSYTWSLNKNTLTIEGFDEFAPFKVEGHQLRGTKKVNDKTEVLEFKEGI
ncbi:MAG: hypothetical protein JWM14_1489 [Chitinophagaceae bacterium]|nr:hypothetical protein [Chitinophagaceae bacterium]